jgi:ABC-type branched-subunit amino acid transport system substrate-binding protein
MRIQELSWIFTCLTFAACSSDDSGAVCPSGDTCVELAAGEPINLASFLDDTSTLAAGGAAVNPANGIDDRRGLEVALKLRPMALGHPVKLVGPDAFAGSAPDHAGIGAAGKPLNVPNYRENCNDSDPNLATNETKANAIIADPTVVAALGLVCSNSGLQVAPIFTAGHVLVVSVNNQAPSLTATCPSPQTTPATPCRPADSFYFRAAPNGKFSGNVLAAEANKRSYATAVTIDDGTAFSHGLATSFAAKFTGKTTAYSPVTSASDMDTTISAILAAGSPAVVYMSNTSIGQLRTFVTKARAASGGLPSTTVLAFGNTAQSSSFWDTAQGGVGTMADGVVVSSVNLSFTSSSDYTTKFLPAYKVLSGGAAPPQNFHAFSFDAYNIVLDAIERAAIKNGDGYLVPRQALRDQLLSHTDAAGLTSRSGHLNCNVTGADPGDCSPGDGYYIVDTIKCASGSCNFMTQPLP